MNENSEATMDESAVREFRPQLSLYHPSAKGTGCALKLELHPAHGDTDGCIMMTLAGQKTVGSAFGGPTKFASFDWEHKITVKLDFSDICMMLQVFRGECETIADGKGLYHTSPAGSTKIVLRHVIEPRLGYMLEAYRNAPGSSGEGLSARIMLTTAEAYGIATSFEHSIGIICFGIPKVLPHDVSDYKRKCREMRHVAVA